MDLNARPEVARFLTALRETQYLPTDRMQAYQRRLLDVLLRHAHSQTEFYTDRLAPVFRGDGSIDWQRWREIPILTRADAQGNFAALTARSLPNVAGEAVEDSSSGSTGRPLRHFTTDLQNLASACCSERFFEWHELRPDALTARIRAAVNPETAYPTGRAISGWRIGHPESRVIDLSIATDADKQIEWLDRVRPDYLISYPSNLRELARVAEARGERLRFNAVLTFGEMTSQDMHVAIREHFGKEPLDRYGASETGHLSGTCPHSLKHHVSAEVVLLEIVDEAGEPAEPGTTGRVIVTPFYSLAMPLIRYEVGDLAIASAEPCGCGRTLPLLDAVVGRSRNVFHFEDGTSLWPVLLSSQLRRFVSYQQFQVIQRTPTDIEFRYVPADRNQVNDMPGLTAYFHRQLHPSVKVVATAVDTIGRSPGGKFEDYICLIGVNEAGRPAG
ncbi:MAG: hypothetical protein WDM84_04125 [Bauldia sp.]